VVGAAEDDSIYNLSHPNIIRSIASAISAPVPCSAGILRAVRRAVANWVPSTPGWIRYLAQAVDVLFGLIRPGSSSTAGYDRCLLKAFNSTGIIHCLFQAFFNQIPSQTGQAGHTALDCAIEKLRRWAVLINGEFDLAFSFNYTLFLLPDMASSGLSLARLLLTSNVYQSLLFPISYQQRYS